MSYDYCDRCDARCNAEYALCDACQTEVINRLDKEAIMYELDDPCEGCGADCDSCPVFEDVIMHCAKHGDYRGNGCPDCHAGNPA